MPRRRWSTAPATAIATIACSSPAYRLQSRTETNMFRAALVLALVVCSSSASDAQSAADPSGHWVGTVDIPTGQIALEVDLLRSTGGQLSGTISIPAQRLVGLPLSKV